MNSVNISSAARQHDARQALVPGRESLIYEEGGKLLIEAWHEGRRTSRIER